VNVQSCLACFVYDNCFWVYCGAVIRELDYLQKQEESKARSASALQWIEACMFEMPSWIHVQSSAETVYVAMTPSVSPAI
jgi:hypothetical protein